MADLPERIVFIVMNFIPLILIYTFLHNYINLDLSLIKVFFFIIFLILGYLINFFIDFLIGLYSFYFSIHKICTNEYFSCKWWHFIYWSGGFFA